MVKKKRPCDFCNGYLEPRVVTVDWLHKSRMLLIEGVPALVCNHCGEQYYEAKVMRRLTEIARGRVLPRRVVKVPVAEFGTVA